MRIPDPVDGPAAARARPCRSRKAWHLLGQNEGHGFATKESADDQFWASLMSGRQTLLAVRR